MAALLLNLRLIHIFSLLSSLFLPLPLFSLRWFGIRGSEPMGKSRSGEADLGAT